MSAASTASASSPRMQAKGTGTARRIGACRCLEVSPLLIPGLAHSVAMRMTNDRMTNDESMTNVECLNAGAEPSLLFICHLALVIHSSFDIPSFVIVHLVPKGTPVRPEILFPALSLLLAAVCLGAEAPIFRAKKPW